MYVPFTTLRSRRNIFRAIQNNLKKHFKKELYLNSNYKNNIIEILMLFRFYSCVYCKIWIFFKKISPFKKVLRTAEGFVWESPTKPRTHISKYHNLNSNAHTMECNTPFESLCYYLSVDVYISIFPKTGMYDILIISVLNIIFLENTLVLVPVRRSITSFLFFSFNPTRTNWAFLVLFSKMFLGMKGTVPVSGTVRE